MPSNQRLLGILPFYGDFFIFYNIFKHIKNLTERISPLYQVFFFHSQAVYSLNYSALPTDPNSSIFSFTVALIASKPGFKSLRGSNPLPSKSLPASMYLRVASWNANWHSVLTLTLSGKKVKY